MKRIIIIVLSLAIVVGFLFWKFGPSITLFNKEQQGPIRLVYWGLWEEERLLRPLLEEYQKQNPNVNITYERKSSINYRTRVQAQIQEGSGPDVFRLHSSWLPMFLKDNFLSPAPADIFSLSEYQTLFYPVALESFVKNNQIYAAPLEIDGLALFYNEELLNNVGGRVPGNWQEFIDSATRMTVRNADGIQTAGASLGTTSNVDHWSDILGLLLLQQPGVDLSKLASDPVAEIFRFYTGFVTDPRKKTWDVNLPNSTSMFAQGRLGFYFAPSWRAHELRVANPNLRFKVVSVPQLSGRQVGWASFWGEAVSAKSQNAKEAWKFVKYLTSAQSQRLLYQEASKVRLFGEPYSQTSLAGELISDPIVGAFVAQGPIYKTWYLSSNTFDNGINDQIIKYFEDGINATLAGTDPQVALQTVNQGVQQVLSEFTSQPAASPQ